LPQWTACLRVDPADNIRHRWQDHHGMGAAILQLHTRKNERLTLGTTRVTVDWNRSNAANALGNNIVSGKNRLAGVCSRATIVESSSCNRLQSLSPGRERPSQYPNKANESIAHKIDPSCAANVKSQALPQFTEIPFRWRRIQISFLRKLHRHDRPLLTQKKFHPQNDENHDPFAPTPDANV